MKTITKEKKVLVVSLGLVAWPVLEKKFNDLADVIFEMSRGLYRMSPYDLYDFNDTDFDNSKIFQQFNLHKPLQDREADEVWVFGAQDASSAMGGSRAFRLTDEVVPGTGNIHRRFPVMRFNQTRPIKTFCQRVEATLFYVYREYPPAKNSWGRFTATSRSSTSGVAGCGSVLYPPCGVLEGYNSAQGVMSNCDDWLFHYPEFKNRWRYIDASEWGGTMEGYLKWWLKHLPHGVHKTDGIHDNWWHYIMNLDLVR